MKICTESLIIREMQIETTLKYHLIPIRMANIKKSANDKYRRKGNPPTLLVGMQIGAATMENSMAVSQKTRK